MKRSRAYLRTIYNKKYSNRKMRYDKKSFHPDDAQRPHRRQLIKIIQAIKNLPVDGQLGVFDKRHQIIAALQHIVHRATTGTGNAHGHGQICLRLEIFLRMKWWA